MQGFTYLQVTGLTTHARYSFRIQARNFNQAGYESGLGCGSNTEVIQSIVASNLLPCVVAAPVQQPAAGQALHVKTASASSPALIWLEWMPPPGSERQFRELLSFSISRAIVVGDESGEEVPLGTKTVKTGYDGNERVIVDWRDEIDSDQQAVDGVIFRYRIRARNRNSLGYEQGVSVLATALSSQCEVRERIHWAIHLQAILVFPVSLDLLP